MLVKDIWPGSSWSRYDPQSHSPLGTAAGRAYFGGGFGFSLHEGFGGGLWVTDGTGPLQLVTGDASPVRAGSELNGSLLFSSFGGELWKTDATPAGASLVKRLSGDPALSTSARLLTTINGRVYFAGNDGIHGEKLWASDGTEAGTAMVADATPGSAGTMDFSSAIVGIGNTVFFTSCLSGCALWKSDGSAAGTVPLASVSVSSTAPIGTDLYFIGNGQELWKSDGTPGGTLKVADAPLGTELTAVNGTLFFRACDAAHGCELWKSDGTAAGTALVKDVTLGSGGDVRSLAAFGDALLFLNFSNPLTVQLWKSDGTDAGTTLLGNMPGQYLSSTVAGGMFFLLTDSQLWASDGSAAGTRVVRDVPLQVPGSIDDFRMTALGNVVVFALRDDVGGNGTYRSDGTAAGTRALGPLVAVPNDSLPLRLTDVNGTLFFWADDGVHGSELWASNGTPESTRLVKDINPGPDGSPPSGFTAAAGIAFFTSFSAALGDELWRSDGTEAGTFLVKDIAPGAASSNPGPFLGTRGDIVLFNAATEDSGPRALWRSDGTDAGTFSLGGVNATSTTVDWRGTTYFLGSYQGVNALWGTDGSPTGTSAVAAVGGDNGGGIAVVRDTLVFFACDAAHGCELWKSDGTASGTTFLRDVNSGAASSVQRGEAFFPVGDLAMFWADDGVHGREPWVTDATETGTRLLADINPGSPASAFTVITAAAGNLRVFVANDGTHGVELWKTDGTPEATALVRDINPGPANALFSPLVEGFREAYFFASDGLTGKELWRSDGTETGTFRVGDVLAGPGSSFPTFIQPGPLTRVRRSGARIFFVADDGTTGFELWSVPIATTMNVLTPCRLLDTRTGEGPPLADGETRRFAAAGACGIPRNAGQVIANVTAVGPTAAGSIEVGPGGPWTGLGTLAFAGGRTRASNTIFAVGTDGSAAAKLSSPGGSTHLVVDVAGYFE